MSDALLHANPNGVNPCGLSPSQAVTCDQDHDYTAEQKAFDNGLMDEFPWRPPRTALLGRPTS